jgi:hypothetical protein
MIGILYILSDFERFQHPLMEDINRDDKKGLEEEVYVLQRISEQRSAPPLTLSISGKVSAADDVLIIIGGPQPQQVVTGLNGCYTFSGLEAFESYTLTPQKSGFTFLPPQRVHNMLDSILTDQDFIAVSSE